MTSLKQYNWNISKDFSAQELSGLYQTANQIETYLNELTDGDGLAWMHRAFKGVTFIRVHFPNKRSYALPFLFGPVVLLDRDWINHSWGFQILVAHELGHVWDINSGYQASYHLNVDLGDAGVGLFRKPGKHIPQWSPKYHSGYGNSGRNEYFAEAFSATLFNQKETPVPAADWINSAIRGRKWLTR